MKQTVANQKAVHSTIFFALLSAVAMVAMMPDLALAGSGSIGGLDKVDNILNQVITWLTYIATAVCTIVCMWMGYRMWAGHVTVGDGAKVIGGAILIAAAAQIANFFFS